MKSSTGQHFVGLDHLRALAAYMVFIWHFSHGYAGVPVPFAGVPIFPLGLLDEGHVGVSLFMVLSGYLFGRLLQGQRMAFLPFLMNRALRLLPLLFFVLFLAWLRLKWRHAGPDELQNYYAALRAGLWRPTLPNGGWSITVECQFYLLLPALLWLSRRLGAMGLLSVLVLSVAVRYAIWRTQGSVQLDAYFSLPGRIDQFVLGMVAARLAPCFRGRHGLALTAFLSLAGVYQWFDGRGGFYEFNGFPSTSSIWVFLCTIEGLTWAVLIAWYDQSFSLRMKGLSGVIARIGSWSYGLYLLHPFWAFWLSGYLQQHVLDMSSFYIAWAIGTLAFLLSLPVAALSWHLIESPFLRWRRPYVVKSSSEIPAQPGPSNTASPLP